MKGYFPGRRSSNPPRINRDEKIFPVIFGGRRERSRAPTVPPQTEARRIAGERVPEVVPRIR